MRPSRWYVRWPPIALASVVAIGAVPGCGQIEVATGGDIPADEVAAQAEQALAPKLEGAPAVSCDEGLSAEDGDRTTCSMTVGTSDETYTVEATVARMGDERYSLDFRSDDYRPAAGEGSIFADEVARRAEQHLADRFGSGLQVSCPDDLAGKVDSTVRCVIDTDDSTYEVTATVRRIDGDRYDLGFDVVRADDGAE